jgi:hypothetical protein
MVFQKPLNEFAPIRNAETQTQCWAFALTEETLELLTAACDHRNLNQAISDPAQRRLTNLSAVASRECATSADDIRDRQGSRLFLYQCWDFWTGS